MSTYEDHLEMMISTFEDHDSRFLEMMMSTYEDHCNSLADDAMAEYFHNCFHNEMRRRLALLGDSAHDPNVYHQCRRDSIEIAKAHQSALEERNLDMQSDGVDDHDRHGNHCSLRNR